MTAEKRRELHRLEGLPVHLSLADGSRLDDVALVSARSLTLWIFDNGQDVFVPVADVVDVWPSRSAA
ncbi:MAG TPA: hypothetical protein VHT97_12445 [Acidimicrobiales bacterium]|nr:hypothetical protein [Acidimicrobiales bacterium]